jgi:hypothetical protein
MPRWTGWNTIIAGHSDLVEMMPSHGFPHRADQVSSVSICPSGIVPQDDILFTRDTFSAILLSPWTFYIPPLGFVGFVEIDEILTEHLWLRAEFEFWTGVKISNLFQRCMMHDDD